MDDNLPAETPSASPVPTTENNFASESVVYHWQDVTEIFKKAAETLPPGVLVKEPNFTLYEAMSAIEIMDAKMDSWMAAQKIKRKVLSFKESIKLNLLKLDDFTLDELILMMDHCHACILSWLEGQSLAQTVFTFAYLHEPSEIKSRPLKAFSYGVLKLCGLLMEKIDEARVFEEEDFQLIHFGFNFASDLSLTRVLGMLREIEDDFGRLIRQSTKPKLSSADDVDSDVMKLDGVFRRFKFLRFFLQALTSFGSKNIESSQNISKIFKHMLEQLKVMKKSAPLHVTTNNKSGNHDDVDDDVVDDENKQLLSLGFEPLLNQRLLPPTFPRYTKLLSIEESYKVYEEIISRMIIICDVIPTTSTFHSLLNLVVEFSRSNSCCVLSRSLVQIHPTSTKLLFFNRCSAANETMKEAIKRFNAPPCLRHSHIYNHPLVKQTVNNFLAEASATMVKVFQVYGHNYARQRDKLGMSLENLSMVQDYGDRCDADINQVIKQLYPESNVNHLAYLGGWTLYHTLKIMIDYVTSGFVLDLYSKHELHYVYWYLCEVLLNWLIQTLNRANSQLQLDADQFAADQLAAVAESSNCKKSARNNNKKTKRNKNKKNLNTHTQELFKTQIWISLGWGIFKAIFGFRMRGEFQSPDFHLDNEETRYEHRFQVFRNVSTPHYLPYKQYQAMTDVRQFNKGMTPEDMFLASSRHFDSARKHCESLPEIEEMDKLLLVAKKNLVVTKILSGPPNALTANKKISLDYSVHKAFPIIKMT